MNIKEIENLYLKFAENYLSTCSLDGKTKFILFKTEDEKCYIREWFKSGNTQGNYIAVTEMNENHPLFLKLMKNQPQVNQTITTVNVGGNQQISNDNSPNTNTNKTGDGLLQTIINFIKKIFS